MDGPVAIEPGGFGELLRRYRIAAGLTQEALAEKAGLSARGLSDLERGLRKWPQAATVRRIVAALNLDAGEAARLQAAGMPPLPAQRSFVNPVGSAARVPVQLTSFIGREKEVAEVERLLDRTRL
ncbi:MAG: helix-turn-helix transcriptional regulator, partial [Chloroflexi bacterium]|nr:helix-turn-helix transcriptional regulator [Chloroflexota bacterium]